jgi:hypothetical protein
VTTFPSKLEAWQEEASEAYAELRAARLRGDLYHASVAEQRLNVALDRHLEKERPRCT